MIAKLSFAVFALAGLAVAQAEPPKKPDPDPAVMAKLDTLKEAVKDKKGTRDQEAVGIVDELLAARADYQEKTLAAFIGALGDLYKVKRKPEAPALYTAATAALGAIGGKEASKHLVAAYGSETLGKRKDWATLQDLILENIGKTKDDKQVKFLLDRACDDPTDGVKVAAGYALRHFEDAPFAVRKDIVKELQTAYARVYNGATQNLNPGDSAVETDKQTLRAVSDKWNETLAKLTGEAFRTSPEWTSWWNDNKNSPKKWKHQTDG